MRGLFPWEFLVDIRYCVAVTFAVGDVRYWRVFYEYYGTKCVGQDSHRNKTKTGKKRGGRLRCKIQKKQIYTVKRRI